MRAKGLLLAACIALGGLPARGQFASPPALSSKGSSGTPLSEVFTPDSLFPKKADPPTPPPAPVIPLDADDGTAVMVLPPPPKRWAGSADLGLNGAYGNSDLLNVRGGWNIRRKTDSNALTSDLQYVFSQQNGVTKTSQALFNVRDEILFPDSRFSPFTATQIEYDEFRTYRFRVGVYGGTSYRVVDDKDLVFKVRAGAGATRELGSDGLPDRWVPEFVLGYDFRWRLTDRCTFVSITDYYPRIDDPRQYRFRARAAFEYLIDPSLGLIYRVGVQDRYDSDPGTAKRNDVTFFTTIGIKF